MLNFSSLSLYLIVNMFPRISYCSFCVYICLCVEEGYYYFPPSLSLFLPSFLSFFLSFCLPDFSTYLWIFTLFVALKSTTTSVGCSSCPSPGHWELNLVVSCISYRFCTFMSCIYFVRILPECFTILSDIIKIWFYKSQMSNVHWWNIGRKLTLHIPLVS